MAPETSTDALAPLVARATEAVVLCDFDGTLSRIVADPDDARPLPGAADVLARLVPRLGVVGLVSGRPVSFLTEHLPIQGLVRRGLYGLDGNPEAERWRSVVAGLVEDARAHASAPGLVEDKGLTLTVHYRTAPETEQWARTWATTAAERTGMVVRQARMSVELLPPLEVDKGTTVHELASGHGAVCFMGDDLGDLAAFAALDRMAANGCTTLKVAVRSDESPPDLLATANLIVDGPEGCLALLRQLADALEALQP